MWPATSSSDSADSPTILRLKMIGARRTDDVLARDRLRSTVNYLVGNDPQRWRSNVPVYSTVEYREVYKGVSLVFHGPRPNLEYDLVVAPGGSIRSVRLRYEGARALRLDKRGDLILVMRRGRLFQPRPLVYQREALGMRRISGRYVRLGNRTLGLRVSRYDTSKPLIVDPVIEFSTFFGGSSTEQASHRVRLDSPYDHFAIRSKADRSGHIRCDLRRIGAGSGNGLLHTCKKSDESGPDGGA